MAKSYVQFVTDYRESLIFKDFIGKIVLLEYQKPFFAL